MRAPSSAELLTVWERGQGAPHVERALLLLAAAEPEETPQSLAALPIGRRDARLLRLRERLFGSRLESVTECAACGERLELEMRVGDLVRGVEHGGDAADEPLWLEAHGCRVRFRLPTSADLMAVAGSAGAAGALLERCVQEIEGGGIGLPAELATAVAARMAEADPAADPELAVRCPACGAEWLAPFDAVSYLWSEVDAWARRTLREIHLLARAYGWSEASILGLGARRRIAYLEMLGS